MSETATAATAAAVAELSGLAQTIGHEFGRPELLLQAVTHKSFRNEQTSSLTFNNERLEYLGDAVLDLAMSDLLMRTFPEASEGSLSKRRASLVNEETLAAMARTIKLDECLRVGRG